MICARSAFGSRVSTILSPSGPDGAPPGAPCVHEARTITVARTRILLVTMLPPGVGKLALKHEAGQPKGDRAHSRFGALSAIFWDRARPAPLERNGHQNYPG